MKTIAFLNNKGGVGKTTLVYHVAWMLAERGCTVLAVDLDPQANLTSMFLNEDEIEDLWLGRERPTEARTVYQAVSLLQRSVGDVQAITPRPIPGSERLFLVPGDLALSDFESDLSDQWPRCVDRKEAAFRITSSFGRIVRQAAEACRADVALMDVGPNLGAINRTALIASDGVAIPLGPDIFSLQGLRNMGPRLRLWREQWNERKAKNPASDLWLPEGAMQPIGYALVRYAVRLRKPTVWFSKWIARMPEAYLRDVMDDEQTAPQSVDGDPNCIGQVRDYKSLMPMAQEANKPMFLLKPADGAIGGHQKAVLDCYRDFKALSLAIARRAQLRIPGADLRFASEVD